MPRRSAVPGEKFWITTSASSTSFQNTCCASGDSEVQQERPLAAVEVAARCRPPCGCIDLDHVGAELGQQPAAGRAGQRDAEVEDAHALQRQCQVGLDPAAEPASVPRSADRTARARRTKLHTARAARIRAHGSSARSASGQVARARRRAGRVRRGSTGSPAIQVGPSSGSSTCATAPSTPARARWPATPSWCAHNLMARAGPRLPAPPTPRRSSSGRARAAARAGARWLPGRAGSPRSSRSGPQSEMPAAWANQVRNRVLGRVELDVRPSPQRKRRRRGR